MTSLVSVVIPTYNRCEFLLEALRSVSAQTFSHYEILVVDDGSTDQTEEAMKSLAKPISYIFKAHGGAASARNCGIQAAAGRYVAFLDSDDLWEPKFLEATVSYLDSHPDFAMVATAWKTFPHSSHRPRVRKLRLEGDLFPALIQQRLIRTSAVVVQRECFDRLGLFNPELEPAEDYDMWLRLTRAYPVAFLNIPLTWARMHSGKLSINRLDSRKRLLEVFEANYDPDRVPVSRYNRLRSNWYLSIGRYQLKLGQVREAEECFRQACALAPFRLRPRRYLMKAILAGYRRPF